MMAARLGLKRASRGDEEEGTRYITVYKPHIKAINRPTNVFTRSMFFLLFPLPIPPSSSFLLLFIPPFLMLMLIYSWTKAKSKCCTSSKGSLFLSYSPVIPLILLFLSFISSIDSYLGTTFVVKQSTSPSSSSQVSSCAIHCNNGITKSQIISLSSIPSVPPLFYLLSPLSCPLPPLFSLSLRPLLPFYY